MNDTYCTMRSLGVVFGASSHKIGRALKEMGLRTTDGTPSSRAREAGLVQVIPGPQSWIRLWLWHLEKTAAILEEAGLIREDAQ
jgi:hypothetical protein